MLQLTGKCSCLCGMNPAVTHVSLSLKGTGSSSPTAPVMESSLYMCTVCSEVVCHPAVLKAPASTDGTVARRVGLGYECRPKHFHKEGNELYSKAKQAGCWLPWYSHTASLWVQNRSTWAPFTPLWACGECTVLSGGLALGPYKPLRHCSAVRASLAFSSHPLTLFCPLSQ